jgi:thioredoxin
MKYLYHLLIVVALSSPACFSQTGAGALDPQTFYNKIKSTKDAVILDVRTSGEYAQGFIDGAKNLDYRSPSFQTEAGKLDRSKTYFVYCLSGGRSASAVSFLRSSGFKEVYDLKGGILAWQSKNLPVVTAGKVQQDKISSADYSKMIASGTVLVDFYAPWCAPCKKMEPWLNEIDKEYADKARVIRINIDENKSLAKELGVVEIPILKIYKSGKEVWQHKGLAEKNDVIPNL